jgi:hypothetical protein
VLRVLALILRRLVRLLAALAYLLGIIIAICCCIAVFKASGSGRVVAAGGFLVLSGLLALVGWRWPRLVGSVVSLVSDLLPSFIFG